MKGYTSGSLGAFGKIGTSARPAAQGSYPLDPGPLWICIHALRIIDPGQHSRDGDILGERSSCVKRGEEDLDIR